MTGEPADWGEGDWNGDGLFTQRDVSTALQSGAYLQGVIVDDFVLDHDCWWGQRP